MKETKLTYQPNPCDLFENIAQENWAILLDSGYPSCPDNFIDLIAARPICIIQSFGTTTYLYNKQKTEIINNINPLNLVKDILKIDPLLGNKFCGGAIGFIGYEYNQQQIKLFKKNDGVNFPDLAFGIYDWVIITNHKEKNTVLLTKDYIEIDSILRFVLEKNSNNTENFFRSTEIKSNLNFNNYAKRFVKIKDFINTGRCYQVNFSQCFSANLAGSSWGLYKAIRKCNPAPFSSYFRIPAGEILSFSPEKFIANNGTTVITEPMKGTRGRSDNPVQDLDLYNDLKNSSKDQAENLMIVDLMRNDLGKKCLPGSIQVPQLFTIKSFAHVHQLISCITGNLKNKEDIFELIEAIIPGGSITGAPKRSSREIIHELEPHNRHIYCGNIGYIDYAGNCKFNIAIRTLLKTHKNQTNSSNNLYFWAGGGIVADSDCAREYEETITKIRVFNQVLQQNKVANHSEAM